MTIESSVELARAKAADLDRQISELNTQVADLTAQREVHVGAAAALDALDPAYKAALNALVPAPQETPVQE